MDICCFEFKVCPTTKAIVVIDFNTNVNYSDGAEDGYNQTHQESTPTGEGMSILQMQSIHITDPNPGPRNDPRIFDKDPRYAVNADLYAPPAETASMDVFSSSFGVNRAMAMRPMGAIC